MSAKTQFTYLLYGIHKYELDIIVLLVYRSHTCSNYLGFGIKYIGKCIEINNT